MNNAMFAPEERLVEKWAPVLEGISDEYTQRVTAQLLENQAKSIVSERIDELADFSDGTTTGKLGTFQKYAFPLVRRVYPELLANKIVGVQPMQGPVSQIFYLGHTRAHGASSRSETVYSKFNLTYLGLTASSIGSASRGSGYTGHGNQFDGNHTGGDGLDGDNAQSGFDVSNVLGGVSANLGHGGVPSSTYGGQVASFPNASSILGFAVSAGERLSGNEIPELSFHIQQQAVASRTRKMRALWTIEASQDLKAYHNLDLERELTDLLSKELRLEIDRELIEDLRMIAYGINDTTEHPGNTFGGFSFSELDRPNPNNLTGGGGVNGAAGGNGGAFVPGRFDYDFNTGLRGEGQTEEKSNVFVLDFTQSSLSFSPRHIGDVYANMLALINIASQDIYKTTMRGPGTWVLTSPLIASFLESSAKLQGGMDRVDAPTNNAGRTIEYKGKFAGKYDLFVDPMYPSDEIMVGYKGDNAMDAGYVYAPYIPLQQLPTVTDPDTFQPRKGILTRYGKAALSPSSRFYRIIRIVGPSANFMLQPFAQSTDNTFFDAAQGEEGDQ